MEYRTFVTFDADFPDDAEWDKQGNSLVPGGRAIAGVLSDALQEHGYRCTIVSQHSFYGWSFVATAENASIPIWCLLQAGDTWLLLFQERTAFEDQASAPITNVAIESIQSLIHLTLSEDDRFARILWYTKSEYERGNRTIAKPHP